MITNEIVTGLRIEFNTSEGDSRSWDNLTKMVCFHNNYVLGDKHEYDKDDYTSFSELKVDIESREEVLVIKPLYLYDHSELTISTEEFNCRWDSGQIGWVYVTKKSQETMGTPDELLEQLLLSEVSLYDQELRGDVYSYSCYKDDVFTDGCGSFYGTNLYKNGMLDNMPDEFVQLIKDNKVTELSVD